MNRAELINAIAQKMYTTKAMAEEFIDSFQEVVTEVLIDGGNLKLVGFGSFDVAQKKQRIGRNPKTGVEVPIPARKVPKFKAGKTLKDAVMDS